MDDETRKQINSLRFNWHERLISDAVLRKTPTALCFAGLVLHRFQLEKGYAEISFDTAMRKLNMQKTSVIRARDCLIRRGWVQLREQDKTDAGGYRASRYTLAGGPDDLLLDHLAVADANINETA
jgi:hypothetical protein